VARGDVVGATTDAAVGQCCRGEAFANPDRVITRILDRECFAPTASHRGSRCHGAGRRVVHRHRTGDHVATVPGAASSTGIAPGITLPRCRAPRDDLYYIFLI
jgi:hypothetical protein